MSHVPVLLNQVLGVLSPMSGQFFIDGTLDGGGHAMEIIKRIGNSGKFIGVDLDEEMVKSFKNKIQNMNIKTNIMIFENNYANLPSLLEEKKLGKADGLLLDLGFSSTQLDANRGFSYKVDRNLGADKEPLDMRYSSKADITAAQVINSLRVEELRRIFLDYGEEKSAGKIAGEIVASRKKGRILTVGQLVNVIEKSVSFKKRSDTIQKVFQALRIYVNNELGNLESILGNLDRVVGPGGRVAIIAFHSLEDRLVKNKFKEMEKKDKGKLINKKPIEAEVDEIQRNPRSRSAKLRAIRIA